MTTYTDWQHVWPPTAGSLTTTAVEGARQLRTFQKLLLLAPLRPGRLRFGPFEARLTQVVSACPASTHHNDRTTFLSFISVAPSPPPRPIYTS